MNIKHGLSQLKTCLQDKASQSLPDFYALEARWDKNEQTERIAGISENTRNEHNQVMRALNALALERCGISFNELSASSKPVSEVRAHPPQKHLYAMVMAAFLVIIVAFVGWKMLVPLLSKASSSLTATPTLTESATTPTFVAPPTDEPFKIRYITFDPTPPANAAEVKVFACTQGYGGVGITLKLSINTAPDGSDAGEWRGLKELGVPCFNAVDAPIWFTEGWQPGTYQVKAEAKSFDDPHWEHPAVMTVTYTLLGDK